MESGTFTKDEMVPADIVIRPEDAQHIERSTGWGSGASDPPSTETVVSGPPGQKVNAILAGTVEMSESIDEIAERLLRTYVGDQAEQVREHLKAILSGTDQEEPDTEADIKIAALEFITSALEETSGLAPEARPKTRADRMADLTFRIRRIYRASGMLVAD